MLHAVIIYGTCAKETQRECLTSFRSVLSASLEFISGDNQSDCAIKHCVSGLPQLCKVSWNRLRDNRKLEGTRPPFPSLSRPVPFHRPPPLSSSPSPLLPVPILSDISYLAPFRWAFPFFSHVVDMSDMSDMSGPSSITGLNRAGGWTVPADGFGQHFFRIIMANPVLNWWRKTH